jgi:hypothetical protein
MSDKAYENAISRREELAKAINEAQQRIEVMRTELRGVDTFLDQWRKFAGVSVSPSGPLIDAADAASNVVSKLRRRTRKNSKKEEVADKAREIILSEGRPLSRAELFQRLIEAGLTIEGTDPLMVLSTMLWRMSGQIVRLPEGYWPTEFPNTQVGYFPGKVSPAALNTANTPPDEIGPTAEEILEPIPPIFR